MVQIKAVIETCKSLNEHRLCSQSPGNDDLTMDMQVASTKVQKPSEPLALGHHEPCFLQAFPGEVHKPGCERGSGVWTWA